MNSAAKLRNRGIAALGATALIATSFGPAAFAWNVEAATASNTSGAASIGVIDSDDATAGTQGATTITPGATNQTIGDVRFVLPSTWQKGDSVTFTLGQDADLASAGSDAAILKLRTSFSSIPSVTVDPTPYAATTHVQPTSPLVATANTGSVEAGKEVKYAGTAAPVAPKFAVALGSAGIAGSNAFNDQITITFENDSNPQVRDAKFIGAINGAKVNVGADVTANQDLGLTAASVAGSTGTTPAFLGDTDSDGVADEAANTTYPATIVNSQMEVAGGSIVADGTAQFVGPVTVSSAAGLSQAVAFTITGDIANASDPDTDADDVTIDSASTIKALAYDASGKLLNETSGNEATVTGNTVSFGPVANAVKIVFSNVAVRAPEGVQTIQYNLTQNGTGATLSGALGDGGSNLTVAGANGRNQMDIERPRQLMQSQATTTVVPTRIGGKDRYETAVKIAEADAGTTPGAIRGETDNVIIASGETFPDALSAGYLAATKNAPILLTQNGQLPQTVVEYLKTYGAKNVFIVGGGSAVSSDVESRLKGLQSYDVQAVNSEVTTSERVTHTASFAAPSGVSVSPAKVSELPGAVTAGALTITYTEATGVGVQVGELGLSGAAASQFTKGALTADNKLTLTTQGKNIVVDLPDTPVNNAAWTIDVAASQQTTVSPVEETTVADKDAVGSQRRIVPLNANLTVTRIAGSNRFETNRKVNEYAGATSNNPVGVTVPEYGKPGKKTALIANGLNPWDSLAAGPLVGNGGGTNNPVPVILTMGSSLYKDAAMQVQSLDIAHSMLIGGDDVLPAGVESSLDDLGASNTRLGGSDRFDTAKKVAEWALKSAGASATNTTPGLGFAPHQPLLVNGGVPRVNAWADALAAGPYAARDNRVIVLTTATSLPEDTKALLTENKAKLDPVIAIGLGAAVSTEVVNHANQLVAD